MIVVKQLLQAKFLPSAVSGRFEDSVLSFQRVVCDGRQGHRPLEPHARLVLSDKKIFQDDPALLVKGMTGKTHWRSANKLWYIFLAILLNLAEPVLE